MKPSDQKRPESDLGAVAHLASLRRELHQRPELSGDEHQTRTRIQRELERIGVDQIVNPLGGHGLAAIIEGALVGPTLLLRADMDALPIDEAAELPHASTRAGVAHKCGHDGHMAMLVGVGEQLRADPPNRGRVVLLFQPAEETGEGAARVLADPSFATVQPDAAVALHNLPGFPLGTLIARPGPFASASTGLIAKLAGTTSHAGEPENGRSPALAVAALIANWSAAPQFHTAFHESAQVTIIHARVGSRAFGTSPGDGSVMATVRTDSTESLARLEKRLRSMAEHTAAAHDLSVELSTTEHFPATQNDPRLVESMVAVANGRGHTHIEPVRPFSWSEDFGHFSSVCPAALFGLGAGEQQPALHQPEYDFPDALLPIGIELLTVFTHSWLDSP